jgi:hypothetical protein
MGEVENRDTTKGSGPLKKGLKMKGTIVIREERGIQWDRSQITVSARPLYSFFLTPTELYSDMKNIVVLKCLNC